MVPPASHCIARTAATRDARDRPADDPAVRASQLASQRKRWPLSTAPSPRPVVHSAPRQRIDGASLPLTDPIAAHEAPPASHHSSRVAGNGLLWLSSPLEEPRNARNGEQHHCHREEPEPAPYPVLQGVYRSNGGHTVSLRRIVLRRPVVLPARPSDPDTLEPPGDPLVGRRHRTPRIVLLLLRDHASPEPERNGDSHDDEHPPVPHTATLHASEWFHQPRTAPQGVDRVATARRGAPGSPVHNQTAQKMLFRWP
jgi:hypothetical protein